MHNVIMKLPYRERPQCGVILGEIFSSLCYTNIIMIKIWTMCVTFTATNVRIQSSYMVAALSSRSVLFHKREHVLTFEQNCPFRISNHALIAHSHYNIYAFFPSWNAIVFLFFFNSAVFKHTEEHL